MLSIITCSIDDKKYQATSEMYARLLPAGSYEMIRISDARSLSEGYNRGIKQSTGDILLLCHDDLEILSNNFAERFFTHMGKCDMLGLAGTSTLVGPTWIAAGPPHIYGQTSRPRDTGDYAVAVYNSTKRLFHNMQSLDGVFIAMHRSVASALSFDEVIFDGFHVYDTDLTYTAYRAGYNLAVATDIYNLHASGGNYDDKWKLYARRFRAKYGPQLPKWNYREFQWARVYVPSKEMICEVMNSPTWEPIESRP